MFVNVCGKTQVLNLLCFNCVFLSSQDAKSQITSLENANGWFERRLAEADSQSEAAKSVTEEKLRSLKEEMEAKAKSDADGWETVRQPRARGTKYMVIVEITFSQ